MNQFIGNNPLFLNWNYTYQCNFECIHCYTRTGELGLEELTTEQYEQIVEKIIAAHVFQVNLGGGEPLMRSDCLHIIKILNAGGVKVNLSTNGWLLDDNMCLELFQSEVNAVFLSLDHSIASIHDKIRNRRGSYDRAIDAIKKLIKSKINVKISTVITKKNIDTLGDLICLAQELGTNGVDLKRFRPQGNGRINCNELQLTSEEENSLFKLVSVWKSHNAIAVNLSYSEVPIEGIDKGCPCGRTSIALKPNGDIAPCVYSSVIVGNILIDDLATVWKSSNIFDLLRKGYSCLGLKVS